MMADIETLPTETSRNAYVPADVTGMLHNSQSKEKSESSAERTEEIHTGLRRRVTHVEHAKVNEAVAQGIAENVDDFMV